ncbi:MAG TPA: hypothetical protein VKR05_01205 [Candidatus Cybelea sp.]|nr:hypothetical protein [Candidatus Cybelea sp.]
MKVLSLARHAFGIAAGVALLAGCSANETTPSMGSGSVALQNAGGYHHSIHELNRLVAMTNREGKGVPAARHSIAHSWHHQAPRGTTGTIWADDPDYGSVDMIAYPSGTLVGQTGGFEYPYGNCSDKSGNVYVADFDIEELFELNSSGSVINSYPTGGEAFGCSVAPNGDVAVTNFDPGDVVIVAGPDAGQNWGGEALDWPGGFDLQGNFYVECADESPCSSPSLYEWPHGGSSWKRLNFDTTITFPGAIQLMGAVLGVADQAPSGETAMGLYYTQVNGSAAHVVKTVTFIGADSCPYIDWATSWGSLSRKPNGLQSKKGIIKKIVASEADCSAGVGLWNAKKGGAPIRTLGPLSGEGVKGTTFTK